MRSSGEITVAVIRVLVVLLSAWAGLTLASELDWTPLAAGAGGAVLGAIVVWLEYRAGKARVDRLFWAAAGTFFGLIAGLAVGTAISSFFPTGGMATVGLPALLGAYLGGATAARRYEDLEGVSRLLFPSAARRLELHKVLDTSVIIDGRIVDVCQAGFIDGTLVVPQFVLHELQQIADSADALKRNRGKRGFDVLQRLQRMPGVNVEITEVDFTHVREVDRKLIELAKALGGKVVTNDYNLNKLSEVSGVGVLNLNELAKGLKPVVLPGELMRVHLLREGKEAGQGVAYLDDGTMVVVEHGKRFLGQTIDVAVTSVLQTSAGRMIFARLGEDPGVGARGA
jgi:uncharacterized protein YacL